ncbi:MAG: biotin/lipoyl-containing protein, partial [Candidatus Acidiferrales bacterium]
MATDIIMPQMGESIFEGTITKWLKKPGEKVERDEPLFEISTDKVDAEIPSPAAGVLKEIKVSEGQTVPIQTVVGVIDGAGSAVAPAPAPAPAKQEPARVEARERADEKPAPASAPTRAEAARADAQQPAPAPQAASRPIAATGAAAPPQRPGTEKVRSSP